MYSHTQKSPLCLLGYITAIVVLVGTWFAEVRSVALMLVTAGAFSALIALAVHHLTVEDQGDRLAIRFGPLPLFRRTVRYADIKSIEVGRTLILEGWGIHYSIRGGWVWNLWGRDCVVVKFKTGGVVRIGTDDAKNLAGFLRIKVRA